MIERKWSARHITDSTQRILEQIPSRAGARGLHVVDAQSIVMMALWSLLLWERKVGRVALERMGVDPFDLARDLDGLLRARASEDRITYGGWQHTWVLAKTNVTCVYRHWDFDAVLEPLLEQAEHEALDLGHNYVGSEHLLLAILRLADPALSQLFEKRSPTHSGAKVAILDLLGSPAN